MSFSHFSKLMLPGTMEERNFVTNIRSASAFDDIVRKEPHLFIESIDCQPARAKVRTTLLERIGDGSLLTHKMTPDLIVTQEHVQP